ncbi:HD domain-containing protein [Patescibacteria group bacterium]|nr:HD domain-containing protein [Patescibacteria group bacterium]
MKKHFNDCIELIQSLKIRNFVKKALKKAPKKFWIAPSSSSNKYHPPEDQSEGGVVIHSRKAVQVAISLCPFFSVSDQITKDKVIAACILHDTHKNGNPWGERTNYEHGKIAAEKFALIESTNDTDIRDILDLIKDHMGLMNKPNPTPALKMQKEISHTDQKTTMLLIVQLADYWASRTWCSFVCDEINNTEQLKKS